MGVYELRADRSGSEKCEHICHIEVEEGNVHTI
jgi:hypothetical protein